MSFPDKFNVDANTALALGSFDGLHVGHMSVLNKTLEVAEKMGLIPMVLLFNEHPKKILCGSAPDSIMTQNSQDEKLKEMGFRIVRVDFSAICKLSPYQFLLKIYCKLNARAVCCGFNYKYGENAAGNVTCLENDCKKLGIAIYVQPEVNYLDEPVSSTRIRQAISAGDITAANDMLGREFSYKLEVVSGDQRGRKLGFPTINQFFPSGLIVAKYGVYASKVCLGGRWYPAVTNIGIRPTFNTKTPRSETCILGFSGDLYGQEIEVFLVKYMREEKKCANLTELSKTIRADAEKAVVILSDTD